jgi:hypothetical protein
VAAEDAKVELSEKSSQLRKLRREFDDTVDELQRTREDLNQADGQIIILKERVQERDSNAHRDQQEMQTLKRELAATAKGGSMPAPPAASGKLPALPPPRRRGAKPEEVKPTPPRPAATKDGGGSSTDEDDIDHTGRSSTSPQSEEVLEHMVNGLVSWAATLWESAYFRVSQELHSVERAAADRSGRRGGGSALSELPDAHAAAAQVEKVARLLCRYQFLERDSGSFGVEDARRTEHAEVYIELSGLAIDPEGIDVEESVQR